MREPVKIFQEGNWPSVFPTHCENQVLDPIASCLKSLLDHAQEIFGDLDNRHIFTGVEFSFDRDYPQLVIAGKYATMQLEYSAFLDIREATSQAAHECVHLLSPVERKDVTFLEEGVATFFEQLVRREVGRSKPILEPRYLAAYNAVQALLDIDEEAILKLRIGGKAISMISAEQLRSRYGSLGEEKIELLTQKFYEDEPIKSVEEATVVE